MLAIYSAIPLTKGQQITMRVHRKVKVVYEIVKEIEPTIYEAREIRYIRIKIVDKNGKEIK